MNLERVDRQSYFATFLSWLFLGICLYLFYAFRGEAGHPDSYIKLSNLKSIIESGSLRHASEPLPYIFLLAVNKILGLQFMTAYQFTMALTLSGFLHLTMMCLRERSWKLNNYSIIYLIAILPFVLYIPNFLFQELLCICFLLILHFKFEIESLSDLGKLIAFSLLAFLCSVPIFLFAYLVFVIINTYKKMQEKKSKPTVFFKKKNIPFRLMMGYLAFFVIIILFMGIFQFYGPNTFSYLFGIFWECTYKVVPIFFIMAVAEYLLRSEKELNTLGVTAILILLIGISAYLSFKASFETPEILRTEMNELLDLKAKSRILTNQKKVYANHLLSDYFYFHTSENLVFREVGGMGPGDYFIVNKVENSDITYLDKKSITAGAYYILDKDTILVSKELIDRVSRDSKKTETSLKILKQYSDFPGQAYNYEKFLRFLSGLFGL